LASVPDNVVRYVVNYPREAVIVTNRSWQRDSGIGVVAQLLGNCNETLALLLRKQIQQLESTRDTIDIYPFDSGATVRRQFRGVWL